MKAIQHPQMLYNLPIIQEKHPVLTRVGLLPYQSLNSAIERCLLLLIESPKRYQ